MGCPGNSTTWTAVLDPISHNVTCTLVGCAAGTVLCGDYCIATPTILTGATCTAASAVSHIYMLLLLPATACMPDLTCMQSLNH